MNVNRRASRRSSRALMGCLFALPQIPLGFVLGMLCLELILRLNSTLNLRDMAPLAPVDPPVTTLNYDIHYSDGDNILRNPSLIQPIAPDKNALEAKVSYQTDEFGFPNAAPLPPTVDVVVVGRSFSMGAQASTPWIRLFMQKTGYKVLNLAQVGSEIDVKTDLFNRFGLPRQPRWLIVEVSTDLDILNFNVPDPLLIERVAYPLLQTLAQQNPAVAASGAPLYPITVQVNGHQVQLVFFPPYLSTLTADAPTIGGSVNWRQFSTKLLSLVDDASDHHVCTALLYTPTTPEVYVPIIQNTDALAPVLAGLPVWRRDAGGHLYTSTDTQPDLKTIQATTNTARTLISQFASDQGLLFIDPTDSFQKAALAGDLPFLTYDTHWSALGNTIVAQQVEAAFPPARLDSAACRK